jgi:tetratricopeptide (TPR) repeat protein
MITLARMLVGVPLVGLLLTTSIVPAAGQEPPVANPVRASPTTSPEPPTLDATLTQARADINRGQPLEALRLLEALDASDPKVATLRGVAYYHADDAVRAIDTLAPAISRLPEGSVERREAVQVLGLSLYMSGRLAESIPHLEETRRWAKDNIELAYFLGNVYVQTRQPEKARASYARLFGLAPDTAAAHLVTAQMMVRLEQEEQADAELKAAIAKDPRLPQAHYLLGQAAIFRGRLAEARTLLEKELELSPGHAMALYRLGDTYTREARWDEAIAALQKSIWLQPHFSGPYILLGRAYMKKGQPATAEGMLGRAIQYDPNNKSAHYLLGQLLQQTGRLEEAKREFEIAEKLQAEPERR